MDSSGHLRAITNEELLTMEGLSHPVESEADIPEWKLAGFRAIDKQGNRRARKKFAKKNKIDWHEYQIYRGLKPIAPRAKLSKALELRREESEKLFQQVASLPYGSEIEEDGL